MSLGAGIAIAGLGIGAGLIGWHEPGAGACAMLFVMIASLCIAAR